MRYELKRIEIWPIIRVVLIFSLIFGFFIGLFYGLVFSIIGRLAAPLESFSGEEFSALTGAGTIMIVILTMILITFLNVLVAALFTALYNLLAASVGGLIFELEPKQESRPDSISIG